MSGVVRPLTRFCSACRDHRHDKCFEYLESLLGTPESIPCTCSCGDENGELTKEALLDMMQHQPEALANLIRFDQAFERGSFAFHSRSRPFRPR